MTKIVIVGEALGKDEELVGHPFVGASGIQLLKMLDQVGIMPLTGEDHRWIGEYYRVTGGNPHATVEIWKAHPEIFVTNVFNLRPKPSNDIKNLCGGKSQGVGGYPALQRGKYVLSQFAPELARLFGELEHHQPNVIIALGATPAWALMKTSGIASIRGCVDTAINGMKVIPTYHPAAMLRDWSLRPIILADLVKAKAEAEFPEVRRTAREIWIEPDLYDLEDFHRRFIEPSPDLSVDIENMGPVITCIGFAPDPAHAIVVPFYDARKPDRNYWVPTAESWAWGYVRLWLSLNKRFVFQNGLYDMHHMWKTMGLPIPNARHIDDTMLLHHAMQPEMNKGLGFLGSVYANEFAWKSMRGEVGTIKGED